jgi:hypothetical protein
LTCSWACLTTLVLGQIESKFTGTGVVLADDSEGMFERLRGTAVQPNSSTWGFDMIDFCFVVVWS